jgi:hypothetical protein
MVLIPSATRVDPSDTGAEDLLRRLADLLPDAWVVAGSVAPKPVSESCRRGHTRPFDAIIIGSRMIFVLDIWSPRGLIENQQKTAFFARIYSEPNVPEGWLNFRSEIEKLKAALHDRFEVEPGRIVPEKIWNRAPRFHSAEVVAWADTADLRSFTRAATRRDKTSIFAPMRRGLINQIATFLTEEAKAAPKRPVLFFADENPMPSEVRQTPAPLARSAAPEDASRPASPAPDAVPSTRGEAAEAPAAAQARPSRSRQTELSFEQAAPIAAPEETSPIPAPTLDDAERVIAKAADAAVETPVRPLPPPQGEVALPPAALIDSPPTPIARREKIPRPPRATIAAAAPVTAKAAEAPVTAKAAEALATAHVARADASLEQDTPAVPSALTQRWPTAHWKWLIGLLPLLLVAQAGTIAWLALFDRAPPHPAPAPLAAPARPIAVPFVVRSLTTSEPMLVGSKALILRAGPSRDFPAVGELGAGTEVVANARAGSRGGTSWIEIAAANGLSGFVPDYMVQPKPAPALALVRAAPPQQTSTPEIERTVAPTPARRIKRELVSTPTRKIRRELSPTPTQPRPKVTPAPARIDCILPGGEEIQMPRPDCRARSGIIYQ